MLAPRICHICASDSFRQFSPLSMSLSRHWLHPHRIDLKQRIGHRLSCNTCTLYQHAQQIRILPLLINLAIIPERLPRHRPKFLECTREGRRLKSGYQTLEVCEEGEAAILVEGRELAGVEGEGISGTVAIRDGLLKTENGAGKDVG